MTGRGGARLSGVCFILLFIISNNYIGLLQTLYLHTLLLIKQDLVRS
jgi:hypothetical protein